MATVTVRASGLEATIETTDAGDAAAFVATVLERTADPEAEARARREKARDRFRQAVTEAAEQFLEEHDEARAAEETARQEAAGPST